MINMIMWPKRAVDGTRLTEHSNTTRSLLTAVGEHLKNTGHNISSENVKILGSESGYWRRKIRESVEIRMQTPLPLNKD